MTIYDFANYVNQDVDDTFSTEEIARWFNKAIANYNLIPPVTKYPFITMDVITTPQNDFIDPENTGESFNNDTSYYATGGEASDETIGAYGNYPLSTNFMLAVMLPYVISAVKGQESSISEKQLAMQEFMMNARTYKSVSNIKPGYLVDGDKNLELDGYKLGENVYLTDFNTSPFAGDWRKGSEYKEVVITRKTDGTQVKYVDSSLVDENVDELEEASKY